MFEKRFDEVPWTTQQTLRGILFTLIPWVVFALILSIFNTSSTGSPRPLPLQIDLENAIITFVFSSLVEGAFLIAPFHFALRAFQSVPHRLRLALNALGFRKFPVWETLGWLVVFFIGLVVVNAGYVYLIHLFHLNLLPNDQRILNQGKTSPLTTYATLIASVLVAPFCEEIFFRGFVFMGLLRSMPLGGAIVLSALIFAVAHADAGSFLVLFVIGLALAFLRWRTRSIWPGMALHFLNNFVGALQIFLVLAHLHL